MVISEIREEIFERSKNREASGLKIAQLAERAGVPYETYRKWEKGDSNPNWEQLPHDACSDDAAIDAAMREEVVHRIRRH